MLLILWYYFTLHKEFEFLKSYFNNNGFPLKLIESNIGKFLNKNIQNSVTSNVNSKESFYFTLPYSGHQSEKLKKELISILNQYFKNSNFNIILVNNFKISSFFSYKDVLPKAVRSSVVYKFCCELCSSEYVGSTTRSLIVRSSEHAGRSHRTGNRFSNPSASNIRDHAESCGSPISLDQFTIIDQCNKAIDLRILESLYIFKLQPKLNSMQSAFPLAIVNRWAFSNSPSLLMYNFYYYFHFSFYLMHVKENITVFTLLVRL